MNNKKGSFLINTGLILITLAVVLSGYNIYSDGNAAKSSTDALVQLNQLIEFEKTEDSIVLSDTPDYILNPEMKMPTQSINGWDYIGVINIRDLGLNLPVIDKYSRRAITLSPACYGGSVYKNDFIICAHNYKSHFGKIGNLISGNVLSFTDVDGNIFTYEVVENEILNPTEIERLYNGDWDLTLISCTSSGQARIAVRCNRIK